MFCLFVFYNLYPKAQNYVIGSLFFDAVYRIFFDAFNSLQKKISKKMDQDDIIKKVSL